MPERPLISVVDDDQSFGESMRRLLKALDYSAAVFPSAAQFLASAQLTATACLVADIHMPEMTGVELYNHLVESGHSIPTILVTAYLDERSKECMLTRGVQCYLRKPLVEAALIDCLRTAVAHGQACRSSR
ncbi:response regulator transcription factor [Dongia soli]|uniref:Response regulator n=1 Tax=Dongia soli TaxID=600628 RepID=A0ABU5EGE1_9PROT|nr:response regulator [Dongia soli]MDY0885312.1 response regulator [Dongia soli]